MNCSQCNQPLQSGARFCPRCGATASAQELMEETQHIYPLSPHYSPEDTVPPGSGPAPSSFPTRPMQAPPDSLPMQNNMSPYSQPAPLSYYQTNQTQTGANMFPATVNTQQRPGTQPTRRTRRGAGCIGCLTALIILLLVVGAGWIFGVQPFLHSMAQSQLDNAMSKTVQQIPDQAAQLPAGSTIPIQESTITNLIVLNLAPSDPIKQPQVSINPQRVRLDFQIVTPVVTMSSAITGVPKVVNGKLQISNVTEEGPVGLVMSPADITALLNKHFASAQTRLQHPIKSVTLKDHEMDLVLG